MYHLTLPTPPPNSTVLTLAVLASLTIAAAPSAQRVIRSFTTSQSFALTGTSIAPAGDVDGDGYDDLIVGMPGRDYGGSHNRGLVIVYSGADGSWITNSPGSRTGMRLGDSVAHLGDVDGDGFDDFAAGSPYDDAAGDHAGYVRVFSGATRAVLWERTGEPLSRFGTALCAVGDLDGDGAPDLAIGRPHNSNTSPYGGVFIHSGRTGALITSFVGMSEAGFGSALACPGDLDGDGKPDLLVGSPGFDHLAFDSGAVFALRLNGTQRPSILWNRHEGLVGTEGLGTKIAVIGDIDQDGCPDVLASGVIGIARVLSGRTGAILRSHSGAWNPDRFGASLTGLGDFNGDGRDDYAIGRPGVNGNGGAVQVRSGASGSVIKTILAPANTTASRFGTSLAPIADLDGDGLAEIAIGAPDYTSGSSRPGRVTIHGLDVVGAATSFGVGCPSGSNGSMQLTVQGRFRFGGRISLDLHRGRPFQPVTTFLGLSRTNWGQFALPMSLASIRGAGCELLVSIDLLLPLTTADIHGAASIPIQVPADPSLVGGVIYAQAIGGYIGIADISASNGVKIAIGNL